MDDRTSLIRAARILMPVRTEESAMRCKLMPTCAHGATSESRSGCVKCHPLTKTQVQASESRGDYALHAIGCTLNL